MSDVDIAEGHGIGVADGTEKCMHCPAVFDAGETYWLVPDGPLVDIINCADCAWRLTARRFTQEGPSPA